MEKYNWRNRLIIACFDYISDLSQGRLTLNSAYGPILSLEARLKTILIER
jgi:hypothetical protein